MAEMEVDGEPLPTQQTQSSNASVNPPTTTKSTSTTTESTDKGVKRKKKENKKHKGEPKETYSEVWDHMTRSETDPEYASCNYCTRMIKCPSNYGTSSMRNHLGRCSKNPHNIDKKQKLLMFQNKYTSQEAGETVSKVSTFVPWKFDQATCRFFCARMIIIDELPFKTVEHEGFRDFVNNLQPQFQIPSRTTITQDVLDIYVSEAGKLKNYFAKNKQRVSLTTDLWSSRQNLSYMCLTAHFIDKDWIIHKRIINFCPVSGHSGEIIGKYLEKSLLDWGLDKVFTITVDNASSNDLCIRYLKRRLNAWKHSVLDSQYLHMRCCAHILSLVIKDGLKEVDTSIAQSAIKFQDAFDLLEEQDSKYKSDLESLRGLPTEEDWEYARCFKKMAARMKAKYDKYWSNTSNINIFLFIAPILDPRYKLGYVTFIISQSYDEEKAETLCSQVEKVLQDLYDHYSNEIGVVNESPSTNSQQEEEIVVDVDDDPATFLNNQYKRLLEGNSSATGAKNELNWYLSEQCESLDNKFDLLGWWKKNQAKFPVLASVARDVLAIPASTVASESSFSTGGRILDAFRSSLTPTTVEALICSQNWLRSKNVPIDIEECFEALENCEADVKNLPQAMSALTVDD
ncbi:hypothetical protein LXL04_024053 [Taraxacum kok-saghyz]